MKTLVIVTGPTGSGKTDLAIDIAESLDTEIVSADSRQIFRGIPIGTAVPSPEQLARVRHHFVETLGLEEYYSAAMYEEEALATLDMIWATRDYAVMCGGSIYIIKVVSPHSSTPSAPSTQIISQTATSTITDVSCMP